jgi:hypothetical protein
VRIFQIQNRLFLNFHVRQIGAFLKNIFQVGFGVTKWDAPEDKKLIAVASAPKVLDIR